MSHSSSIYTLIFFSIVFITVDLLGEQISSSTGTSRALLTLLGTFSLKVAIDDYVHFESYKRPLDEEGQAVLHKSLIVGLLIYLCLAFSTACAAMGNIQGAELFFILIMVARLVWLCVTESADEFTFRLIGWRIFNLLAIFVLSWDIWSGTRNGEGSAYLIYGLVLLCAVDAFAFGTLRRLAKLDSDARV